MRGTLRGMGIVSLVVCCVMIWNHQSRSLEAIAPAPATAATTSAGPTIESLKALAELTTLKAEVADASETTLSGYLGGTRAVLIVRGEVTIGVDLSAGQFLAIDNQKRSAILQIPKPQVQLARLDHERTRLVAVLPSGLWWITPGEGEADTAATNLAFRDAQRQVAKAADDPALIEKAQNNAEHVLQTFFAAMGWSVEIRWGN